MGMEESRVKQPREQADRYLFIFFFSFLFFIARVSLSCFVFRVQGVRVHFSKQKTKRGRQRRPTQKKKKKGKKKRNDHGKNEEGRKQK